MSKSWRKWSFFYSAYKLTFSFGLGVIRGQVGVEDCVLGKGLTASLWEQTVACRDSIRGVSSRRNRGQIRPAYASRMLVT